jgi:dihydroorotate dehydrogenase (NAD+) catalytic subunit
MVNLAVDLGFIQLKNPLMTASGTCGYGEEFAPFINLDDIGAIIFKGIYLKPRLGNPPPRLLETAAGMMNSIGLAGPGAQQLQTIVKRVADLTCAPLVINVCGETDDEYQAVAEIFSAMPQVAFLELNISCPNVHQGGRCAAQDKTHTYQLVKRIKNAVKKPVMVKLSPNAANITEIAQAAEDAGADCLSLVNTFLGLAVDLKQRKPIFKNIFAGLSGPAIKPLALKLVYDVCRAVKIPVIGIGGISCGQDVLEYILVGAAAVQIGTINMIDPQAVPRILREIVALMDQLHISSIAELRGGLTL